MSTIIIAIIGAIGVIIGSVITLVGNYMNQRLMAQQEQKKWENQQIAEKEAWKREEEKKEKDNLREIYQNSMRSLSVFLSLEDQNQYEQKELNLIEEIHKWVILLLLRHPNSKLSEDLNSFTELPDKSRARKIKNEIIKLSGSEKGFFFNELKYHSPKKDQIEKGVRIISIQIKNEYRKQKLIEGLEIPQEYTFNFEFSAMTESQRSKLVDIFFPSHKAIPNNFSLWLPSLSSDGKKIEMRKTKWQAKLNPNNCAPQKILASWDEDFDNALIEAEKNLKHGSEK